MCVCVYFVRLNLSGLGDVSKPTFLLNRDQVLRINAESEEHIQLLKELEDDEGWEVRLSSSHRLMWTVVKLCSAKVLRCMLQCCRH